MIIKSFKHFRRCIKKHFPNSAFIHSSYFKHNDEKLHFSNVTEYSLTLTVWLKTPSDFLNSATRGCPRGCITLIQQFFFIFVKNSRTITHVSLLLLLEIILIFKHDFIQYNIFVMIFNIYSKLQN